MEFDYIPQQVRDLAVIGKLFLITLVGAVVAFLVIQYVRIAWIQLVSGASLLLFTTLITVELVAYYRKDCHDGFIRLVADILYKLLVPKEP